MVLHQKVSFHGIKFDLSVTQSLTLIWIFRKQDERNKINKVVYLAAILSFCKSEEWLLSSSGKRGWFFGFKESPNPLVCYFYPFLNCMRYQWVFSNSRFVTLPWKLHFSYTNLKQFCLSVSIIPRISVIVLSCFLFHYFG